MPTRDQIVGAAAGGALGPFGAAYGYVTGKKKHTSVTWYDTHGNIQHANTEADKIKFQKQERERQNKSELAQYDVESGKFYDQMRAGFRQRAQSLSSAQQTGAMNQLNQAGARAGISFSGIQQAATANLQGQIGAAQVQAETAYDQRLNELRQTQRNEILSGQFDFWHQIQLLQTRAGIDKDMAKFQADMANQFNSGWNSFFNTIATGAGLYFGGPAGAAAAGTASSAFTGGFTGQV